MGEHRRGRLGRQRLVIKERPAIERRGWRPDLKVGDNVVILNGARAGAPGRVEWIGIDGSCGCYSVIVATEYGEWWGKRSEVS